MNVKTTRMLHNYMSCFPHRANQALPLIKHSGVNCTQLCIIHQAFLSMEDVFIIHTRQHFKLTHHKLVSKRHPLIGPCLFHQDHRQQQERGTRDCRRILIASWPCRKMWKNAMLAATIFPKNFVSHYTTSWSSTSTVGCYAGTRAQERWCTAQTLPTLIAILVLYISWEKTLFLTTVYISTLHLPLPWRRPDGNSESLWIDCEYRLIRNNSTSIDFFFLPFRYSSLFLQKTL